MLSSPEINFHALIKGSGDKPGARERFERLVTQLVKLRHSAARRISANPGDWGLDVIVGELDDGAVSVWQPKFFIDGVGKSQQDQIRDALKQVMAKAKEKGYEIDSWTLCIPVSFDAATAKWWDSWRKARETEHGIRIQLWDDSELEALLLTAEAREIRATYFGGPNSDAPPAPAPFEVPVQDVPAGSDFDDMLFIKQLKAANVEEVEAAKHQFFNAEILSRDVVDRGVPEEMGVLAASRAGVHALWENHFNRRCSADAADDLLTGLHADVMDAIKDFHYAERPEERSLRMALVHRWGSMHEIVEAGRAGWIRAFRKIASDHGR